MGDRDVHHARNVALAEPVREALAAGQVDVVRAAVITAVAAGVRAEHAERLVEQVLPRTGRTSVTAVRARCRRAAGSLDPDQAREVAAEGIWRRLLTDPSGRVLVVGEKTSTPSALPAALVRADHDQCTAPWCGRPARDCDLDHLTPWPSGRPTGRTCTRCARATTV